MRTEFFITEGSLSRYQAKHPELDALIFDPDHKAHFIFTKDVDMQDFTWIHERWAKRLRQKICTCSILGTYNTQKGIIDGVKLQAPKMFWNSSKKEIDKYTGGCGPGSFWDKIVPNTLWGLSIFNACRIHDWMYYQGKTEEDRKIADSVFLDNMLAIIEEKSHRFFKMSRRSRAMIYYSAVRDGGKEAFFSKKMTT